MTNNVKNEQEQFDNAWQEAQVPGDVVVEQVQQAVEDAQEKEQQAEDFKAGWTEA